MKRDRHLRPVYLIFGTALALGATLVCSAANPPAGDPVRGAELYMHVGCYACHGTRGAGGGTAGPPLAPNPPPLEVMLAQLRRPARAMPAYGPDLITDAAIRDIHAYLASIPVGRSVRDIPQLQN